MPRTGPRMTLTVAAHRTARSRSVPRLPQCPSGARQSPTHGKRLLPVSQPLRPCQARQGEDGLPPVADAGNKQGQGLDGGEFASYLYCQTLYMARRYPILAGLCMSKHSPALPGGQTQQHSIHAHEWISLWHSQQRKRNPQAPSTAEGLIGDPSETRSWKAIDFGDVRGNAYCVMRSTHQSKVDKLRPALSASTGGWKAFI